LIHGFLPLFFKNLRYLGVKPSSITSLPQRSYSTSSFTVDSSGKLAMCLTFAQQMLEARVKGSFDGLRILEPML
jgi:hypothetical protein